VGWVDEARGLLAVDVLLQVHVKKSILDVMLVNRPGARGGGAKDNIYCCRFDNWAEGFIIVDVVLLGEATDQPTSLVKGKRAIRVEFTLINPLAHTMLAPEGRRTRRWVPLSMSTLFSSAMAARQFGSASPLW